MFDFNVEFFDTNLKCNYLINLKTKNVLKISKEFEILLLPYITALSTFLNVKKV